MVLMGVWEGKGPDGDSERRGKGKLESRRDSQAGCWRGKLKETLCEEGRLSWQIAIWMSVIAL